MPEFTSVFNSPDKGVYAYSMGGSSLKKEEASGRSADGVFGQYLYSRPIRQVLMRTGERYVISFYDPAMHVKYRKHDEDLSGSFDYYRIGGAHQSTLIFSVLHSAYVPECKMHFDVKIDLKFDAPRSFQFRDMCKTHLVSIELCDGIAMMRFYKSASHSKAEFETALRILAAKA